MKKIVLSILLTYSCLFTSPGQTAKSSEGIELGEVYAYGITENSSDDIFICLRNAYGIGPFVAKSTDYGNTWTFSDSGFTWAEPEFIICDENDDIYFCGHETSLYKSSDNGISWQQFAPLGIDNFDVYSITITENGYLYLGVFDSPSTRVLRTTDGGVTWQDCSNGINSYVNCITSFQNTIFAGTLHNGLLISTNHGSSWQNTTIDSGYVESVVLDENGKLYSSHNKSVLKSTDMGVSWSEIFSSDNSFFGKILPITEERIFLINWFYIYRTTNGGAVWDTISTFVNQVTYLNDIYFSSDSALYLTSDIGVFKSFDFGDTWNSVDLGISSVSSDDFTPENFKLEQNFPNPFNPNTIISYQIPVGGDVTLKVYDLLGREVATLVDEYRPAGEYEVEFSASSGSSFRLVRNPSSGIYFYTLRAGDFIQTKKMVLIK
jgi:photosystem II stability/assembly factor-like uncharacterized protein